MLRFFHFDGIESKVIITTNTQFIYDEDIMVFF